MSRRDGLNIVFNIHNVYITINPGGIDFGNNNNGSDEQETNQNPVPTETDVNQRNNFAKEQISSTSSNNSKSTDAVSQLSAVLNAISQPPTSRLNENSIQSESNDTLILCRSLNDPEIAKQVSADDKISQSAVEQSLHRSELAGSSGTVAGNSQQLLLEKRVGEGTSANVTDAKPDKPTNVNNEPCIATAISGTTESRDTILTTTATSSSTELVNTSIKSKSSDKVETCDSEANKNDENKENNGGRPNVFNPNLTFNFSSDLLKMKEKEANSLVLSERPSFQFTNRRSAPNYVALFTFKAKSEGSSVEETKAKFNEINSKVTQRKMFSRAPHQPSCFLKKGESGNNEKIEQKKT